MIPTNKIWYDTNQLTHSRNHKKSSITMCFIFRNMQIVVRYMSSICIYFLKLL